MVAETLNLKTKKYINTYCIPKLMNNTMKEIKIYLPSLPEQSKLSCFFKLFDDYSINLEKQKEKVEQVKKYCLQNMLINQNKEEPSLRFNEFREMETLSNKRFRNY